MMDDLLDLCRLNQTRENEANWGGSEEEREAHKKSNRLCNKQVVKKNGGDIK